MRIRDRRPRSCRVPAPALLLLLCALPAATAAQDTLVLRDGRTRTGRLTACVGSRCALGGEVVMREEIAWIGLAADGSPPRSSGGAEDEVWLADGSSRRGAFVGLSLGIVNLGASSLDRDSVRWIRLASPLGAEGGLAEDVATQPLESDALVRRDGALVRGHLVGCGADSCVLDGTIAARDELAWVGLGVGEQALPPGAPPDPSQDAVQLQGGPLQTASLLGIDDASVVTERGSHARASVDWIYLAARPRDLEGAAAGSERAPVDPPETEIDPPPPPPPPPPIDTPTPDPSTTSQPPGERGGLWIGTIQGIYGFRDAWSSYRHTFQQQVRLREYPTPQFESNGQQVQRAVLLWSEGSTHGETYVSAENPQSDWPTHCSGQGSTTLRNEPAGWIYTKLRDVDLTPVIGFDQPVGSSVYHLAFFPEHATSRYEPDCASRSGSWKNLTSFVKLDIGRHPRGDAGAFPYDAELRYLEGGRMVGSYQRTQNEWYAAATWSLCRAGENCPLPVPPPVPGPPPTTEPCPPPTIQRGLLDVEMQRQRLMMNDLSRTFREYSDLSHQASQYRNDYEQAARDCGLWQVAMILGGFLISNPGVGGWSGVVVPGNVTQEAANALGGFYNFLGLVDKFTSGDSSWLLPDVSFKDFAKIPDGRGGFLDAESIYDGVRGSLEFLEGHVGASSPESMLDDLRSCGAPTLDVIMDDAIHYLRLLQQIAPLMRQVQETLDHLEDADERIFNAWVNYRQACLEHQACIGGDPSICDQLPAGVGAAPPNN